MHIYKNLIDVKIESEEKEKTPEPVKGKKGKAAAKAKESDKKKDEKPKDSKSSKKAPAKKKDIKSFEPILEEDTRQYITTNYGIAKFNLQDLLKPSVRSYENNDATNLDLNTKARKETRK
eukprot:CAMPEP_0114579672 /NCGR_PEP_ID=MMETSP0125-20121206/4009_1 /TAXON_ID=485358 ORGANISM="Aristerostoma sp., Strain ATCC 50986" /NCGR_SAMPLE_ID=MMETSP0125 /ASSEMBLY_ACC=CAM_ASM_000245 /LENGTH=119 /DNA_ID=CAMNT_0001770571 /DNA_START=232 /DNA_END=588 /DNA_ORIENTATION=+